MAKTLANFIDLVQNIHDQINADAVAFKATAANKRREAHISGRIKELETNYLEAKAANVKIIAAKEETNLKAKYYADETFINLKGIFLDYLGELNEALHADTKDAANASINQEGVPEIKLRRIELPPFAGGYEQWRPFYELYISLIHENQSLTDIQKLHYLKSSIRGEAARLLQHVSIEAKNYSSACAILVDRYENKRVLVNTHLKILLNSKQINMESSESIKCQLDTTTECIHSLRNLGVPVDKWDTILIHILCNKLPSSTQELWEEHLQGAKNLVEFTTFSKFLETRFRTLEAIEHSKTEIRRSIKRITSSNQGNFNKQTTSFHTSFSNKMSNNPQKLNVCVMCKENHALHQCSQFQKMDTKTRLEIVKTHSACVNCLAYTHFKSQCNSKYRCRHCNQMHHTLLHLTPTQSGQNRKPQPREMVQYNNHKSSTVQHLLTNENQREQATNSQLNSGNTSQYRQFNSQLTIDPDRLENRNNNIQTLFTQRVKGTKVLLATALINCQSYNGNYITLRALIDPGSEATFITEAAVQMLRLQKRKTATNIISLGQSKTGTSQSRVTLTMSSTYSRNFNFTVDAFVYANITSTLPSEHFYTYQWEYLEGLQLADPLFHVPGKIEILLGADVYSTIIQAGLKKGPPGSPIAQNSKLGWIISGNLLLTNEKKILTHHQLIDVDSQLRRFWEIEEVDDRRKHTEEEKLCEEHYVKAGRT